MGVLRMKQVSRILPTYAADVSGVCSALYELGGLTVMHDASGCNSTYNTHDEPRWYTMESMVYISALTEYEAVLGADDKLINDIVTAAKELKPRFIAVAGTPIPMMTGTDFEGVAKLIERETGIPAFGFDTNSMHSYQQGVGTALAAVARRFCLQTKKTNPLGKEKPSVNLLGVTPLDFSIMGGAGALKNLFETFGYEVISCWAMGSTLDDLMKAGEAHVNVVVSNSGMAVAKVLRQRYGTPWVAGLPIGRKMTERLLAEIDRAAQSGTDAIAYPTRKGISAGGIHIVGEAVSSLSLAAALTLDFGIENVQVLCPLECDAKLLGGAVCAEEEDEIETLLKDAGTIIADPMFKPLANLKARFLRLPHEACSGRIWREEIPVLINEEGIKWLKKYVPY